MDQSTKCKEKDIRLKLHIIGFANDLLSVMKRVQSTKIKVCKLGTIKKKD